MIGIGIGLSGGQQSPIQRVAGHLRSTGLQTDYKLASITPSTATSTGPVTVANGETVRVVDGKTWRVV